MNLVAAEVFGVLMRWVHITSVAVLIGGVAYARLIETPALDAAAPEERPALAHVLIERYRPLVFAAIAGLLVSGLYNFFSNPGHTRYYYIWFGIKMLLVLHVFAAAFLMVRPTAEDSKQRQQRTRRMTGIVISGLIIILISAYLRRIF